jgi:hypothetical protein
VGSAGRSHARHWPQSWRCSKHEIGVAQIVQSIDLDLEICDLVANDMADNDCVVIESARDVLLIPVQLSGSAVINADTRL